MNFRRLMGLPLGQNPGQAEATTFGGGAVCASQQELLPMSQMGHSRRTQAPQCFAQCPLCLRLRSNCCVAANDAMCQDRTLMSPSAGRKPTGGDLPIE